MTNLILLLLLLSAQVSAGQLTLAWTPAPGTPGCTLDRYRIDYGTAAGVYTQQASTATAAETTLTIAGLPEGQAYHFAAKSLGTCGGSPAESGYSNAVSGVVSAAPQVLRLSLAAPATFAPVVVGGVTSRRWSIANLSNQAIDVDPPTTDRPEFAVRNPVPRTIPPGGSTWWTVAFSPTAPGWTEGRLTLRTGAESVSYPLSGFAKP